MDGTEGRGIYIPYVDSSSPEKTPPVPRPPRAPREVHIPYVDANISAEDLKKYNLDEYEKKLEIQGEKFSIYIMDFRKEGSDGEKASEYPLDIYAMGFGETDPIKANELSAEVIERAKEKGSVLVIPRFRGLLKNTDPDAEAKLLFAGLESLKGEFASSGIDFDLASHDIDVIGFSDGGRISLEIAGRINRIKPAKPVKRTLNSMSPTAVIDLVEIPENATGAEMMNGFIKQVTWITLEEARLKINASIEDERIKLNRDVHLKMATGEIAESESDMAAIVKVEMTSVDEDGLYKYPLLAKGFITISEPHAAYDSAVMAEIAASVAKLLSYNEGRLLFKDQFDESSKVNLPFLNDVIVRALSVNSKFTPEDFKDVENGRYYKAINTILDTLPGLKAHLLANETRSEVCDHLETFDVVAVFPMEDLAFPDVAYGRTIRKKFSSSGGIPASIYNNARVYEEVKFALDSKDDDLLGKICMQNPKEFARILYPNAHSVSMRTVGDYGHLSGTHLSPMKDPKTFFGS